MKAEYLAWRLAWKLGSRTRSRLSRGAGLGSGRLDGYGGGLQGSPAFPDHSEAGADSGEVPICSATRRAPSRSPFSTRARYRLALMRLRSLPLL